MYQANGVRVTAFLVDHGPVKPAFGYRVEYRQHSVVLSGDTRPSENLMKFAKGADLLIHEVGARSKQDPDIHGATRRTASQQSCDTTTGEDDPRPPYSTRRGRQSVRDGRSRNSQCSSHLPRRVRDDLLSSRTGEQYSWVRLNSAKTVWRSMCRGPSRRSSPPLFRRMRPAPTSEGAAMAGSTRAGGMERARSNEPARNRPTCVFTAPVFALRRFTVHRDLKSRGVAKSTLRPARHLRAKPFDSSPSWSMGLRCHSTV